MNNHFDLLPNHQGEYYIETLKRLHAVLMPKTYLEIGVFSGQTLQLSRCASIGIDPKFESFEQALIKGISDKPELHLFQCGSDDFFASRSPSKIFGRPVDMIFLDGMHRCEYLLRDFMNIEPHCRRNSLIMLHDCLPLEEPMTDRVQHARANRSPSREGWWTGDVCRTALALKRYRPDLMMTCLDAHPTGLIIITNLDPTSQVLERSYQACVTDMLSWDLDEIGILAMFDELAIEPTAVLATDDLISRRYWL